MVLEYPLTVVVSGTPVAGSSSRVGCSASLLPISPPMIITDPFAMTIADGYQRGTWRDKTPGSSIHSGLKLARKF